LQVLAHFGALVRAIPLETGSVSIDHTHERLVSSPEPNTAPLPVIVYPIHNLKEIGIWPF